MLLAEMLKTMDKLAEMLKISKKWLPRTSSRTLSLEELLSEQTKDRCQPKCQVHHINQNYTSNKNKTPRRPYQSKGCINVKIYAVA